MTTPGLPLIFYIIHGILFLMAIVSLVLVLGSFIYKYVKKISKLFKL